MTHHPLPPGSTIGVLGNGQLGRMLAIAAARLGYRCHVFGPGADSPAEQVATAATVADYDDEAALDRFADAIDVVTLEFENVPHAAAARVAARVPARPSPDVLAIAQDRLSEKTFLNGIDQPVSVRTAMFAPATDEASFRAAVAEVGPNAIAKTTTSGYDGKGQVAVEPHTDLAEAWRSFAGRPVVVEGLVPFLCEVSVVIARGMDGASACFDTVENEHRDHILHRTVAPARIDGNLAVRAQMTAKAIADALDLVGLLAVEMFVTPNRLLLVNEIAPRPHNSGHWTIDSCATDQFEQTVRAVCGLPLGDPSRHHDAEMLNLLGDEVLGAYDALADPTAHVHLYGKAEPRPGRKMGHITRLRPLNATALPG